MPVDPRSQILQPFRPTKGNWEQWDPGAQLLATCYAVERYFNRAHEVQVITAIENVNQVKPGDSRFEYHISVTGVRWPDLKVFRCSNQVAQWVLEQFGFTDFAEDNHVAGGKARNYWRPIVEKQDPGCECFETEPTIVEDKGDYIWRHAPD
jgi:hypothetical protein